MKTLFEHTIDSMSTRLLSRTDWHNWQGQTIDLWLYQDRVSRLALEKRLTALTKGQVRVRSAYKPLLHFFLEEVDLALLAGIQIHYPLHPNADAKRFLLEAYPLANMLSHCKTSWVPFSLNEQNPTMPLQYLLTLTDTKGQTHQCHVDAPNKLVLDHLQETVLCPTGYLRISAKDTDLPLHSEYFDCEIESAYSLVMNCVQQYAWPSQEPYFERLEVQVDVPGAEVFDEQDVLIVSTLEALHEDLYFSILEFFQKHSGRAKGDRGLQPGQIVPDIRYNEHSTRVRVVLHAVGSLVTPLRAITESRDTTAMNSWLQNKLDLALCTRAVTSEQIQASLSVLKSQDTESFYVDSYQKRRIEGLVHKGSLPSIVLTGGQHANEASGVVGALRGAMWLASQPEANFAVVPLENPDGYDLCHQYYEINPQHMHHAARYTGLGDDLEYREKAPWYESEARMHAIKATQAQLHISLHGYPAHEWTRPFTGYLPRGFELWSIPKGFFLIIRYQQAWREKTEVWLEMITQEISRIPLLAAFNQQQLALYASHTGDLPFEIHHGIPCLVSQNDQQTMGVKLVTEFPDETLFGDSFRFAQEVQTQSVRIAAQAWWELNK